MDKIFLIRKEEIDSLGYFESVGVFFDADLAEKYVYKKNQEEAPHITRYEMTMKLDEEYSQNNPFPDYRSENASAKAAKWREDMYQYVSDKIGVDWHTVISRLAYRYSYIEIPILSLD